MQSNEQVTLKWQLLMCDEMKITIYYNLLSRHPGQ